MRRFIVFCIVLSTVPFPVRAEVEYTNPLITEVMAGIEGDASAEYVEIYNPFDEPYTLADHELQYKSATGDTWLTKIEFNQDATIEPRGYSLLVTQEFVGETENSFTTFNSGLSALAGHVRLAKIEEAEQLNDISGHVELVEHTIPLDTIGWGEDADSPELLAAIAHKANQSLKRLMDEDGNYIDTNDNSHDFFYLQRTSASTYFATSRKRQPGGRNSW